MSRPLRVLIVEDEERDAALLVRELKRGGFALEFERVDDAKGMGRALEEHTWDIVISDYSMPSFSAAAALAEVQGRGLDLPFIIVSGSVNEDLAVEVIRAGAHDFMAKGNFARLIPAIERELREADVRAERASMRDQLQISDRMASLGTLAAGIAHEINNPLATLLAHLAFATDDLEEVAAALASSTPPGSQVATSVTKLRTIQETLRGASECGARLQLIAKDLLLFSHPGDGEQTVVDLHRVLDSSLRMAGNEVRHRARLVKDYRVVPPILANEAELGQVFLNLVVNSVQAIPVGAAEDHEISISTYLSADGRVVAEVRDTGEGMTPDQVQRAFEPFLTTKPRGVGTGLGLAICRRVVAAQGGEIHLKSEPGRGTTVRTTFPAVVVGVEEAAPAAARVPSEAPRRCRVLVVDDEPTLGMVIQRMLAKQHDVVVESAGRDAIARITAGERFDAILCDLMMPTASGMDVHEAVLKVDPEQAGRMVFMTGGAFAEKEVTFLARVENARLDKPFDAATLRAAVARVMDEPTRLGE